MEHHNSFCLEIPYLLVCQAIISKTERAIQFTLILVVSLIKLRLIGEMYVKKVLFYCRLKLLL